MCYRHCGHQSGADGFRALPGKRALDGQDLLKLSGIRIIGAGVNENG
jgi:hypothetical protein